MKKFLYTFLSLIAVLTIFWLVPEESNAATLSGRQKISDVFKDPEFAQTVASALNVVAGSGWTVNSRVAQADLDKLNYGLPNVDDSNTFLIPNGMANPTGVTTLEGIQYLNKVQSFAIRSKGLTTATIAQLGNINANAIVRRIQFSGNNTIDSIAVLSKPQFQGLWEILLDGSKNLTSLDGLQNSKELQYLKIQDCNITDLKPVSGFTKLRSILARNNRISDISPIAQSKGLEMVTFPNETVAGDPTITKGTNRVTNLSALADQPNLWKISFRENGISDISPLKNDLKLTVVWLDGNQIEDPSPLAGVRNATEFALNGNRIKDISSLKDVIFVNPPAGLKFVTAENAETDTRAYSRLQPFKLNVTDLVKSTNGLNIVPAVSFGIGSGGMTADIANYSAPFITWNLGPGISSVRYKWQTTFGNLGIGFSGFMQVPLVEKQLADFTISNTILNCPDNSQTMTYTVKTFGDDRQPVNAGTLKTNTDLQYANKLVLDPVDPTKASFTLASGESLKLPVLPNGYYEVTQDMAGGLFKTRYTTQAGNAAPESGEYPATNPVISKSFAADNNRLDFVNTFGTAPLTITNRDLSPQPLQTDFVYTLALTWPSNKYGSPQKYSYQRIAQDGHVIETKEFIFDGQPLQFLVNHGEKVIFPMLPVTSGVNIKQAQAAYYYTSVELNKEAPEPTEVDVEIGIKGGLVLPGAVINYKNKADYQPPQTGITDNNNTEMILITGLLGSGLLFVLYLVKRNIKNHS